MYSDNRFTPLAYPNWQKSQGLVKRWKGYFTAGHSRDGPVKPPGRHKGDSSSRAAGLVPNAQAGR